MVTFLYQFIASEMWLVAISGWLLCTLLFHLSHAQIPQWNTTIPNQNVNASAGLPVIASTLYTVHNASILNDSGQLQPSPNGTWNHGPQITFYKDVFYVSWYNSPRDEAHNQRVLCKTSKDGQKWMKYPIELFPAITEYPGVYNEPFVVINDELYAMASVLIDGATPNNKGYVQLVRSIDYINDENDYKMSEIFWLTDAVPSGYENFGYQTYLDMSLNVINAMQIYFNSLIIQNVDSVSTDNETIIFNQTASMYLLPTKDDNDYAEIVMLLRAGTQIPVGTKLYSSTCRLPKEYLDMAERSYDCKAGTQMFVGMVEINLNLTNGFNHSQYQNICNWTKPVKTNIPDAPARSCTAQIPDDVYYLVGNQIGNEQYEDRSVLTLSFTDASGLYYNSVYAIRYDPPPILYPGNGKMKEFAYPSAYYARSGGKLFVVYDVNKENIQMSIIDLSQILPSL